MGRYFEDFAEGEVFTTPGRTVTEADTVAFAGLSGDYNPIHTDEAMARETPFGARIAHGLLGLSIATGLMARLGIFDGTAVALLGIEEWRFTGPIHFGDTIHAEVEIAGLRPASDGTRGVVTRRIRIVNQSGEVVQTGVLPLLVRCRPAPDPQA